MLHVLATVLLAAAPDGANATQAASIQPASFFASKDPTEIERRVRSSFDMTDRNGDGFIDLNEAPIAERGQQDSNGVRVPAEASNALWIRLMDANGDNRVDWSEMRAYLLPRYLQANGL